MYAQENAYEHSCVDFSDSTQVWSDQQEENQWRCATNIGSAQRELEQQ